MKIKNQFLGSTRQAACRETYFAHVYQLDFDENEKNRR